MSRDWESLVTSTDFDMLTGIKDTCQWRAIYVPSARGKGSDSFWVTGTCFICSLGMLAFYLATRNPSRAQFELGQDWTICTALVVWGTGVSWGLPTSLADIYCRWERTDRGSRGPQNSQIDWCAWTLPTENSNHSGVRKKRSRTSEKKKLLTCKILVLARHDDA